MSSITYPRDFIADTDGRALEGGSLYVGEPNLDTELNPVQLYWDSALTDPATQPISISAGYAMNSGARAALYSSVSRYSMLVKNRAGDQVDYIADTAGGVTNAINVQTFGAVGDGVTDDTAAIQAAIDYAQTIKAWIYFPPVEFAYMVSGLTIGQAGANYTCHFMGGGFDPSGASQAITGQFTGQSMIKLINGSDTHLVTINPDAAQPQFQNITFNGNNTGQSGTSYCIYMADTTVTGGRYKYACHMENCFVQNGLTGGIFIGSNRGSGYYRNTWVQYCGTATSDAAVTVRCFDQIFDALQVGPNNGIGMDIGAATQIQMSNCVLFLNYNHLNIQDGCEQFTAVNCVFDAASHDGVVLATGNTGQYGSWTFAACTWQRNGSATNNTYADIVANGTSRLNLIGPTFLGNFGTGNIVKYNIFCDTGTQNPHVRLSTPIFEQYSGNPYGTAFTNAFFCLTYAGSKTAGLSPYSGEGTLSVMCNDFQTVQFAQTAMSMKNAAFCDPGYVTPVAANGGTTTMSATQHNCALLPAAGIATYAVNLPVPQGDGQIVRISTSQSIGTLTVGFQAPATTVLNNSAAMAAGQSIAFMYISGGTSWVRI